MSLYPTSESNNPVKSGGVYSSLALKFDSAKIKYGVTDSSVAKQDGIVTFSTAFDDANYIVFVIPSNSNSNIEWSSAIISQSASGFVFETKYLNSGVWTAYYRNIYWMAIHF